jgi:hypothetical protein
VADETSRWILVGNCLHKTGVVFGLASIASGKDQVKDKLEDPLTFLLFQGFVWPTNLTASSSFGFVSLFCTSLYAVSWDTDSCVQYQIERNPKNFPKFPSLSDFSSPVVLAYKSNKRSKYLHRAVTTLAVGLAGYRIYEALK